MMAKGTFHEKSYPVVKIQGQKLKRLEPCKYLGVEFGEGLSTVDHVDRIAEKIKGLFESLARIAKNEWSLGYAALKAIYRGVFVPITTYAAAAWYARTYQPRRQKLIIAQRYCLMKIIGAYRTSAASSLTTILAVTPIARECEKAVTHYKLKKGQEVIFRNIILQARQEELARESPEG